MTTLQYILSIGLLGLGGLLAVSNGWIFISQIRGKHCPSAAPFIGGIFLFLGGILFPGSAIRPWAWIGLFLDYGCMPYLIMASVSIWMEKRRYAKKNQLMLLNYDADGCHGTFSIYLMNECVHKWQAKDGKSSGSMIMRVDEYDPDTLVGISLQAIKVVLRKRDGVWRLASEEGWHNQMHSLINCTITERPLTLMKPPVVKGRF